MKRTCAWCKRELSDTTAESDSKMPVSHGMCSECAAEIRDQLCGDVIECAHADLPGGCGKTEFCAACAIRNSVTQTLATGRDLRNIAVLQQRKTTHGIRTVPFLVTTEKVGPFVFLQVDREARTG